MDPRLTLRVAECVSLRVMDFDFSTRAITVRNGKGAKDRTTLLAEELATKLQELAHGSDFAPLPGALARK
jgi:site-specific recombinase XerD